MVLVIVLCVCSSHGPTVDHPQPSHGTIDAGTSPVATAPSEAECNALFDHVRAVKGVAEDQWRVAGQPAPVRGFRGIGLSFTFGRDVADPGVQK